MEPKNENPTLGQKWNDFFFVLFDPWIVFLLLLVIGLIISTIFITEPIVQTIITTLISVVSGLLGGIISYKWSQITEVKVLIARGKTAIRGLKLILLNIANIENRTKHYICSIDLENKEYKLIKNNFEEVIEKCNILEEEIISSIENWTDIIPEVHNLKTQIGILTEMKSKESNLELEIQKLNKELESVKEEDSDAIKALKTDLDAKVTELTLTKKKLVLKEAEMDKGIFSGFTGATYYGPGIGVQGIGASGIGTQYLGIPSLEKICKTCGKTFLDIYTESSTECPKCRNAKK
jgi:hypothetical protein